MYLVLDTNILIDLERGEKDTSEKLLSLKENRQIPAITSITYTEVFQGYLKIGKSEKETIEILDKYTFLNTTKESSIIAAKIRNMLEKRGNLIPTADILIASIVITNNSTLVTKDQKHFKNIENLKKIFI